MDERKVHMAEMRMLRWMFGVTRMDKIRNENLPIYIRVSKFGSSVWSEGKVEELVNKLAWHGKNKKKSRGRPEQI